MLTQALLWAAGGSGFTFLMTTLGAATVFLFRRTAGAGLHRIMLGFAAGVMIAASMWSLLIPAIEQSQAAGGTGWIPAAGGSILGIAFLSKTDRDMIDLVTKNFDKVTLVYNGANAFQFDFLSNYPQIKSVRCL